MKKVFYVGYYADEKNCRIRDCVLAATTKMEYICSALVRSDWQVEIVSASSAKVFQNASLSEISPGVWLKFFSSLGSGCLLRRLCSRLLTKISMFIYLLLHVKSDTPIIVYHSLGYMWMLKLLKKLKKIKLILEVEEIYADVVGNQKVKQKELDFFRLADSYIFPTELLDESINKLNKPSVIIYGTYKVEPPRHHSIFEENENAKLKHLLYAGTFDPRKGGAAAAAAAAANLSTMYNVHILGFGGKEEKNALQNIVDKVNAGSGARVSMDGLLSGEEYIRFVQSCDVGFSTQQPNAAFNNTSFPSKVLSYLANGLRVVSVRIPALERSKIGHLLYYYDGNDAEAIADAVMSIDWQAPYDSRAVIRQLDEKFVKDIQNLLYVH